MLMWWRLLFAAALAATAYATLSPLQASPLLGRNDKLIHCMIFGIDTALGLLAFRDSAVRRALLIGLVVFGCTIEAMQAWVPYRQPSTSDALANALGVSAAALTRMIGAKLTTKNEPSRGGDSLAPDP